MQMDVSVSLTARTFRGSGVTVQAEMWEHVSSPHHRHGSEKKQPSTAEVKPARGVPLRSLPASGQVSGGLANAGLWHLQRGLFWRKSMADSPTPGMRHWLPHQALSVLEPGVQTGNAFTQPLPYRFCK